MKTDTSAKQAEIIVDGFNVTAHIHAIEDKGYTIVPDFLPSQQVDQLKHAFTDDLPITEMRAIGTDSGRTWRAHNLLAKTRAADHVFLDPRLRSLVQNFLQDRTQINVTTLFNTLPGETRQFLHQDDGLWPIPRPHPHFLCNALIALDDFDVENGATHLVPYSHKWHDRKVDQSEPTIQVEMKAGSMVVWAGAMWHAGGANVSDRERMGLFISHGVSYLRPQEAQLVSVPQEIARTLPEKLQRLLGYHRFGLGVDGRDPVDVLNDGIVVHPDAHPAGYWREKYDAEKG